ncbi:hypothetical protein DLM85_12835 [Hymenobacter edaphi]|uniref:Uncharacterized protein n=2 Tax=Hymenobacter edaphi TaxID=2211146 RepID=A0A328BJC4_9BACT|nr:hypothetical protein DLM85_12835 [Hymenobacter edaphi]
MSILRYEKPDWQASETELTAVFDAWVILLAILAGTLLLSVAGLGIWLGSTTGWAKIVAVGSLVLVLLASPLCIAWWVVRPMWTRCRRTYSSGALATLLLSLGLTIGWLWAGGACGLCLTGVYCV